MSRPLEGKVILITGAGTGIGRATAIGVAAAGGKVVATGRGSSVEDTVAEILGQGGEAVGIKADVSKAADVLRMVETSVSRFGRLDGAFNNAGIYIGSRLVDTTEADYDEQMAINLRGVWLCMREELRQLLKQGSGGSIVNHSSAGGLTGAPNCSIYGATKHGIIGLTKSAALEYATDNIRINSICPATVDTPMLQGASSIPEIRTQILAVQPTGRFAQPSEVASVVVFLLSDAASYVNGAAIPVDGGIVAQ